MFGVYPAPANCITLAGVFHFLLEVRVFRPRPGMPRRIAARLALRLLLALPLVVSPLVGAADAAREIVTVDLPESQFSAARDALIESIETEGLVIGGELPIADMLARTRPAGAQSPYRQAVTVQFCSSLVAWQLVLEDVAQAALCPLAVSLIESASAGRLAYVYRQPAPGSAGRQAAGELLRRIVARAADWARLR